MSDVEASPSGVAPGRLDRGLSWCLFAASAVWIVGVIVRTVVSARSHVPFAWLGLISIRLTGVPSTRIAASAWIATIAVIGQLLVTGLLGIIIARALGRAAKRYGSNLSTLGTHNEVARRS